MRRTTARWILAGAAVVLGTGIAGATTRELAELQSARLSFGQSLVNQLTNETYRDPFDELHTRPYNLLFTNIGRHPTLSPWPGQQGMYTRYVNALVGNNGTANVDNDADTVQGSMIRRERPAFAWGLSAAVLAGSRGSDDAAGSATFVDDDDLTGVELRGAAALQLGDNRVIGAGATVVGAGRDQGERSFEPGVGGFLGTDDYQELGVRFDVGMRTFRSETESWEAQFVLGYGTSEKDAFSETIDDTGAVTDRFVITDYDLTDLSLGVHGGYNRRSTDGIGEWELRAGLERTQRELDNDDLAYAESGGVVTPNTTLVDQDAVAATRVYASGRLVFPAGETEVFTGARLGYGMVEGSTTVDAAGILVTEDIDDTELRLSVVAGLRQALYRDKFRFVVSARADLVDAERATLFDIGADRDSDTRTVTTYSIGVEGVLANVNLDVAWLFGDEAPVTPVELGLPQGSRRSVELDRLVFSASVAW